MGVFKRYKNAQAAQKDAENAMPGAYQSNTPTGSTRHWTAWARPAMRAMT